MKIMNQWLQQRSLRELLQAKQHGQRMNRALQQVLESRLHGCCRVLSYDPQKNCLKIEADNASIATQLRFQAPQLMVPLRKRLRQPGLASIQVQVRAQQPAAPQAAPPAANRPNQAGAAQLRSVASHCQHPRLSAALKRLASRHK